MRIAHADVQDVVELLQVEIDTLPPPARGDDRPLELRCPVRLQLWTGYITGEIVPDGARTGTVVLKAILDGRTVGFIAGHLTTRFGADAEIQALHVIREHEHSGIDLRLLLRFITWARQHEARALCVGVTDDSPYYPLFLHYGGRPINPHWMSWDDTEVLAERVQRELTERLAD